jgi:mediator of RNA polymerase II transcription subunit 16, fungi type
VANRGDRKVAWSNLGCIAYVKRDGNGLVIRNLLCRPEDGKWTLGGEFPVSQVSPNDDGQQIVHLSWNPSGADLAVVDVLGRLSIYTIYIAVNRLSLSRPGVVDQEDDLGAIVGMAWLNMERMVFYPMMAARSMLMVLLVSALSTCFQG